MIFVPNIILRSAYTALLVGGICEYTRAAPPNTSPSSSLFHNANENTTLPVNSTVPKLFQCVRNSANALENRIACSLTTMLQSFPTIRAILLHFPRLEDNILQLRRLNQQAQGPLVHLLRHR